MSKVYHPEDLEDHFFLTCDYSGQLRIWTEFEGGCDAERIDQKLLICFGEGCPHRRLQSNGKNATGIFGKHYPGGRKFKNVPQFGKTEFMEIDDVVEFDISRPWELPWPGTQNVSSGNVAISVENIFQTAARLRLRAYAAAGLLPLNPREILRFPSRHEKYLKPIWKELVEILEGGRVK